ncbi:hypothetical protein CASFOL_008308 [Castilleja foliolosa]|uniref:Uncharacterized protein n=1 Tax=Castilleja foliolosa TaxID=1961234 RepID=A0ABD3DYM0_9LAMI
MSLRRSRSESEIIKHRTDKDYGLAMKTKNEDTTFQRISAPPACGKITHLWHSDEIPKVKEVHPGIFITGCGSTERHTLLFEWLESE